MLVDLPWNSLGRIVLPRKDAPTIADGCYLQNCHQGFLGASLAGIGCKYFSGSLVEVDFAAGRAEVVGLAFVVGRGGGDGRIDVHAADGVLTRWIAISGLLMCCWIT